MVVLYTPEHRQSIADINIRAWYGKLFKDYCNNLTV